MFALGTKRSFSPFGFKGQSFESLFYFLCVLFYDGSLIGCKRNFFKVTSDRGFAFQYQPACAVLKQVEIAADTGHTVLTAAPERVRAVGIAQIIIRRGPGQAGGFGIMINQHVYHVSDPVCFDERGGQLSRADAEVMHR